MILLLNENKYSLTRDGYSVCFVFKINCVCLKAKSFKFLLIDRTILSLLKICFESFKFM